MNMKYKATHTINLSISPKEAWDKLKDLSLAPCYVPGVESVEFLTDYREGEGVVRRVYPQGMDESVISWKKGKEILLSLSKKGKEKFFPFKKAAFRYIISETGSTFMRLSLEYEPILGAAGQLLFGGIIQKRIIKTAVSLQKYYNEN